MTTAATASVPPVSSAPDPKAAPPQAPRIEADAADPLLLGLAFVAQFFGQPASVDNLRAGVPLNAGGRVEAGALLECAARASLAVTALDADAADLRATMLPALALGGEGSVLVVLNRDGERFECHVPGIEGSRWFDAAALQREIGEGTRWFAVRPTLHFDQRSLLYTFDQPGQTVKKGDLIARLDSTQFDADLGESQQSMYALKAMRIRLDALLAGATPEFGAALEKVAPAIVAQERRAWLEGRTEYQAGLSTATEAVRRASAELAEAQTRVSSIEASMRVAKENATASNTTASTWP